MDAISGTLMLAGNIDWLLWPHRQFSREEEGFEVVLRFGGQRKLRDATRIIVNALQKNGITWLKLHRDSWSLDIEEFRRWFQPSSGRDEFLQRIAWLEGFVPVEHEIEHEENETTLWFKVYREAYMVDSKTKIFLSHKGADKPMVMRYFDSLKMLGFDPWLDVDAMPSGAELHRGIRQGFTDSCAVIFFITPNFLDESHLRNEVNYAVEEKTAKGDRFAIITLVSPGATSDKVPEMLHSYVWKNPQTDLEGLNEIIRALPIAVGPVGWRPGR